MKHQPDRTCIGCRNVKKKNEVIRVVAAPSGMIIDYREKLPGRAAYICPRTECIRAALEKDNLNRSLRIKVPRIDANAFLDQLKKSISEKVASLIGIAFKAGKIAAGYSAVSDACEKGKVELLIFATDLSEGTESKLESVVPGYVHSETWFTRDELGRMLNRELIGVVAILEKGFADAVGSELQRLKNLIKTSH